MDARLRPEDDFYGWAMAQSDAARRRAGNELDWDGVSEALRLLGVSEERELYSRWLVLLTHLLKWIIQPDRRGRSWLNTIALQRRMLARHMSRNPDLKPREPEAFAEAYADARLSASSETDLDLDLFPVEPPFTIDEARNEAWLPE